MNPRINEIFSSFQDYINSEQEIREEIRGIVKDIEKTARNILTILQSIHQEHPGDEIPQCLFQARKLLDEVKEGYTKLAKVIPKNQYYRYHDHWKFVTQRLSFLIALTVYLEVGMLVSRDTVAEILGVEIYHMNGFHLDLEDYLMGLLQLSSELARFAINSVTNGDYNRPLQISKFIEDLNAGFRLLNLKNDALRKRFDALKYDVKRIEEIVYDLSIRGLRPGSAIGNSAISASGLEVAPVETTMDEERSKNTDV